MRGELLGLVSRRSLHSIPLVIGVSLIAFGIMHLAPGGPLAVYTLNPRSPSPILSASASRSGSISRSTSSISAWVKSMLTGTWGYTLFGGRPVLDVSSSGCRRRCCLMGTSMALAMRDRHALGMLGAVQAQLDLRLSGDDRRDARALLSDILVRSDGDLHLCHQTALAALRRDVFARRGGQSAGSAAPSRPAGDGADPGAGRDLEPICAVELPRRHPAGLHPHGADRRASARGQRARATPSPMPSSRSSRFSAFSFRYYSRVPSSPRRFSAGREWVGCSLMR